MGAFLALFMVLSACSNASKTETGGSDNGEAKDPYKIGVNVALTGPIGWLGENTKRTIDLYVKQVNAEGGIDGHPIEVIYYDNESKPEIAQQGARKLIEEEKVALIIGGSSTPDSNAIAQVTIPNKVPQISMAGSWKPDPEKDWAWTSLHTVEPLFNKQFQFIKDNNIKNVAMLYTNDALGQATKPIYDKLATQYPEFRIVAEENINVQNLDVKPQLNNLKSKNPEIVIVSISGEALATVRKQMTEVGLNIPLLAPSSAATPELLKLLNNIDSGLMLAVTGKISDYAALSENDPQKPIIDDFVKKFEAEYDYIPGYMEGVGFDAIHIALTALDEVGPDGQKINEFIKNLKNFAGVTGIFNYDQQNRSGLGSENLIIVEINNNEWKKIDQLK